MAELVYAFDLKSNGEIRMGSSPISGTKIFHLLEGHPLNVKPLNCRGYFVIYEFGLYDIRPDKCRTLCCSVRCMF